MCKREGFCRPGPHWIPIVTATYLPLCFFITYGVAVANGHVSPGFPYISDTGTKPPESCLFGQFLAIGAVLSGVCVYIRYKHITIINRHEKLNTASLILGCIASVGLSVVGNFQETSVHPVHILGAVMAFGIGVVYMWTTVALSFKIYPAIGSMKIAVVRVVLSSFSTVFAILVLVGDVLAIRKFQGDNPRHWHPSDGGYVLHVISTASEWLMAFTFCSFYLTFATEFYHLRIHNMAVSDRDEVVTREEAERVVV